MQFNSSPLHGPGSKQAELARMRRIATLSLIGVFIVLVMSSVGVAQYPALAWLRAFAEAGTRDPISYA